MGLTRGNTELVSIFSGKTLNAGGVTTFNEFPLGEALTRLILRINIALTVGTGTTPISESELGIIKSITLRNSRNWVLFGNVPARGLYYLNQLKDRCLGVKDAMAAATATYRAQLSLWFADPMMIRPEDFILDSSMFQGLQLEINAGTVADLLGTPGTATIALTCDLLAERIKGRLPVKVKPREYPTIFCPSPVSPAAAVEMNLERANNLAIKRILVQTANSATIGQAFSGTPANTTIASMGVDTDKGKPYDEIIWTVLNALHKTDSEIETLLTGYATFDFCKDRSRMSALMTGLYSRLRLFWTNGTLSTSQVSAIVDGFRKVS